MLRLAWRVAGALAAALLVTLAAWAGCNLVDSPAAPTPGVLALPAPPGETPLHKALAMLRQPAGGAQIPAMKGALLACPPTDDCTARWLAEAAQIGPALAPFAALGERCVAALADLRFVEPLPADPSLNEPLAPHGTGASQCAAWLALDGLAAAQAGERERALQRLGQGQRLSQALLTGSHTLIANAIAWSVARRQYQATAAVLALQPGWAADLAPLAAELPAEALNPRRWVAAEAAWQRGVIVGLRGQCDDAQFELGPLTRAAVCTLGVGLLPELTRQEIDARWVQRLAAFEAGERAVATPAATGATPHLAFRNTVGRMMLSLAEANYAGYFARQSDVELQRRAVALGTLLVAEAVPLAQRAEWLQRQALPATLKLRIRLAEDGRAIVARPWASDADPGVAPRPVRVPLPDL